MVLSFTVCAVLISLLLDQVVDPLCAHTAKAMVDQNVLWQREPGIQE